MQHVLFNMQVQSFFHLMSNQKMATDMLLPVIFSELVDSDDKKQTRGKTRKWIKRTHQLGSFQNIVKELIVEDR